MNISKPTWIIFISTTLLWIIGVIIINIEELDPYLNLLTLILAISINTIAQYKDALDKENAQ